MIKFLTREQIIEGIIASIVFPLSYLYLKKFIKSYFLRTMISWFTTWFFRKVGYNTYIHYFSLLEKDINKYESKNELKNQPKPQSENIYF